ncbi:type II secretion system F family protein [Candidatus Sumerlaeota bacterium]|nr:type II secretion system F family protein [Candidatus Sumerlaeota bacterium]
MMWLLPYGIGVAALFVAVYFVRKAAYNRRIAARLAIVRGVAAPPPGAPPWMRGGFAEEFLGVRVDEESFPPVLGWFGREARRGGLRLGSLDVVFLLAVLTFAFGFGAQIYWGTTWISWCAAIAGPGLALILLHLYANRRVRRIEEQLADMLDATVGALQAGIGLRQALEIVRSSRKPPMSEVLGAVFSMMDVGIPLPEAMRRVSRHLGSKYFELLTMAIDANVEAGSSLSPMFTGLSQRIRDGIRLRRRIRSLTAEARFSVLTLFAILYGLAFYVWLVKPGNIIYLFHHPLGIQLIRVAFGLQIFGILWILHLLRTDD